MALGRTSTRDKKRKIQPSDGVRDDVLKRSLGWRRRRRRRVPAAAELGFNFLAHAFWPFVKGALA